MTRSLSYVVQGGFVLFLLALAYGMYPALKDIRPSYLVFLVGLACLAFALLARDIHRTSKHQRKWNSSDPALREKARSRYFEESKFDADAAFERYMKKRDADDAGAQSQGRDKG